MDSSSVSVSVSVTRPGHPKRVLTLRLDGGDGNTTPQSLQLQQRLRDELELGDQYHVRLIHRGRTVAGGDDVVFEDGAKITCLLSSRRETEKIASTSSPNDRMPSMEYEYDRERARTATTTTTTTTTADRSNPRIGRIATFAYPKQIAARLTPSAAEVEALLGRVANDPGIVHIMNKWDWRVGVLSELPPDGYVGVSPVCVLGLNVDKGREIKLRVRTDDLRGLRKYHSVIDTMLHELVHNVYEGHGVEFKELNSTLKGAYATYMGSGRGLVAAGAVRGVVGTEERVVSAGGGGSRGGGRQLGTTATTATTVAPGLAAAQAAMSRAENNNMQSYPILGEFVENEHVLYHDRRRGLYVDAIITSVDRTIQPNSYTVDLFEDGVAGPATTVGRETEASRLSKRC